MSRSGSQGVREDGFSLVEVVVAIGIVMTLLVAVLPQLIGGIQATDLARSVSQAKTLASSELERMRNLPFHVSPSAGDFVDLFDRYFHDLDAASPPACAEGERIIPMTSQNVGYVSAQAPRCDWEPVGPFYRVVRSSSGPDADPALDGFVVSVSTQFLEPSLDAADRPVWRAPAPGYDTTDQDKDTPASAQVGVTVAVTGERPSARRPVTTYSQIARSYQSQTQARATADATGLTVGLTLAGATPTDGNNVSVAGGLLHLDASLVASSRVEAAAAGLTASAGTGQNAGTTRTSGTAPPTGPLEWTSTDDGELLGTSCQVVCWGRGEHSGIWTPRTADGLPGIGAAGSPVQVALKTPGEGGFALRIGMGQDPGYLPGLGLANPLVRMKAADVSAGVTAGCRPQPEGGNLRIHSGGWAEVTDPAVPEGGVDACAVTHTAEVSVLPPGGSANNARLTVQLLSAWARCRVKGPAHSPQAPDVGYAVRVRVYDGSTISSERTITYSSATGAASGTLPSPGEVGLGAWIDSWSVALPADGSGPRGLTTVSRAGEVRAEMPAVMSILTKPLRQARGEGGALLATDGVPTADPQSALSLTLGSVSCSAEDYR